MINKYKFFLSILVALSLLKNASAQNNFKKLDNWMAGNTREMGGRSILVLYKDGKIIYNHSESEMNLRQKMAVRYVARRQGNTADMSDYTLTTRLRIASCSKWLSAALVMTFIDDGKLKLTDTVGKYLPVLSANGKGKITISQCLSHLTGIKAPELKENLEEMRNANSMDDAIAEIAKMPMEGQPGKVFHYSNVGLQIAGAIVEKISGKSFETLFAERIAQPVGMRNTDFGKGKVALPAGGAYSTPEDYLNFLVMIMNKGVYNGKRILSESSVAQMQVNRVTSDVKIAYSPAEAKGLGYGFGEWTMGSNGVSSPGLFGSFPWVNNEKKYCGFLMTFYIKNTGRNERYMDLMTLVNEAVGE
ncbi:serine hydrolase [Mucilaginibacter sp. L3T2-6]|uniref:serine hydrolase domain-containing protein n=1 Tax=Mucilaginibacter sp. L3T2-6 TaxID=3062491 RepID=UPI00267661E4|nr:serine hydrolase domain-containing protein [Mucilaginibacter sp. L3T2-6]MDO3644600.1 serine hydrolase domain-containing protein [Mucilaginibacter sp. L3T2-6]MDV6217028.1 serine hydrolase domain-containing protein [Mucilaginibacter sp. L3T2-6]